MARSAVGSSATADDVSPAFPGGVRGAAALDEALCVSAIATCLTAKAAVSPRGAPSDKVRAVSAQAA